MLLLQGESSSAAQNQKDNSLVHTQLQPLVPLLQCYQHPLPPALGAACTPCCLLYKGACSAGS